MFIYTWKISFIFRIQLEALEFLHESDYVHADIKGSNLLTGVGGGHQHEVYLVDYGLAYRYRPDGVHKDYIEDPRRKHDGTIEFTSIDAHKGASKLRIGVSYIVTSFL